MQEPCTDPGAGATGPPAAAPIAPWPRWGGGGPPSGWHGAAIRAGFGAEIGGPIVVKIGGSLLGRRGWPALVAALAASLADPPGDPRADPPGDPRADPPGDPPGGGREAAPGLARGGAGGGRCRLFVVGGGAIVDGLRAIDAAAPRDQALVHALAIDAMRLTARLVADAMGLPFAAAPSPTAAAVVLDVPAWLAVGDRGRTLPAGWGVTSDSIAARVAVEHGAALLLAKSVPPSPCPVGDLARLVAAGWVDDHFAAAADPLASIAWAAPIRPAKSRGPKVA